ncbi:MAG: hypothetical protein ABMA15_11250 [Vicinamibacterales bacterium]
MNRPLWMLACVALLAVATPMSRTLGAGAGQTIAEQLTAIGRDTRADASATTQALRAMNPEEMNPEDRATWVRLSREAATRLGDRATLQALKDQEDPLGRLPEARIILAHAFMDHADFSSAHAELGKIVALERVNARDQRRYWALEAKLGLLEGNVPEERKAIEHIVHELGKWLTKECQSCHGDLKNPRVTPLLDVQSPWFAKRFVELMKLQGDAAQVRAAAERTLATDASDSHARIMLGFSLLAQGDEPRADDVFREIPWLKVPGRTGTPPRAVFAWP